MAIELSQTVEFSPDVLFQEVSGEAVLLHLKKERYFGLDKTATRIWQLLEEKGDLQTAFDTMLAEYDVEEGQLRKDFSEFLGQLDEAGLISIGSSS